MQKWPISPETATDPEVKNHAVSNTEPERFSIMGQPVQKICHENGEKAVKANDDTGNDDDENSVQHQGAQHLIASQECGRKAQPLVLTI